MIVYSKKPTLNENNLINDIAVSCGLSFDTARLLFTRNIDTVEKAKVFLHPSKSHFINPFLLSSMREAVDLIKKARDENQNILIFGDYDVDGICATTVLYKCLKDFGIVAEVMVPEREGGYGLNVERIQSLNKEKPLGLIITVDCGISEKENINKVKDMGIDVIVTDHHEIPENLPDCITINPKLDNQEYSFKNLCGAGVAYKLGSALIGDLADEYLDYVAIATVADSMELTGENRDIVFEGLKILNSSLRTEFKYLVNDNGKQFTAQSIAYTLAPRINAGGRMGDASSALRLFITDKEQEKLDLAVKLNAYNMERQAGCDSIYKQAKDKIMQENLLLDSVILVKDENWKVGFLGIVAAKLVEEYSRPVIVFSGGDGICKGSARSIEGVNIFDVMTGIKDYLVSFGGHSQAAGISIEGKNLSVVREKINVYVKERYKELDVTKKVYAEWNIEGNFNTEFAKEIELLEPFGMGNKRPCFTLKTNRTKVAPLKEFSPHYSFKSHGLEMLYFNGEKDVAILEMPIEKTVLFEANVSSFKGKEFVKGIVKNIYSDVSDLSCADLYIFENELKKLKEDSVVDIKTYNSELPVKGFGTIFSVADYRNLENYKELADLPTTLFSMEGKSCANCVVISLNSVPEGFNRIIYLDEPLQYLNTDIESFIAQDLCGYEFLENITCEREEFANIFSILCGFCGKEYKGSAFMFDRYDISEINGYQFVFVTEVFLELGFFYVENGVLKRDLTAKNQLTNSKIYNKIYSVRG